MRSQALMTLLLALVVGAAGAEQAAQHVRDIEQHGFLSAPTGEPPEMTAVAGERFLKLVLDSQREVCRIVLLHEASQRKGLYRLNVVDARGGRVMRCSL
jgi:hypothetical protein